MPIKFYYRPRRISIKSFVHDVPCSFYAIVEDAERPLPRGETLHAYPCSSSTMDTTINLPFLPPSPRAASHFHQTPPSSTGDNIRSALIMLVPRLCADTTRYLTLLMARGMKFTRRESIRAVN